MACGTVLLKLHVMQVKLLHLGQKKVGHHHTVAIIINSYVTVRSMFEEVRSHEATSTKTAPNCDFSGCIGSF